ncbi:MAG: hypothetical protein JSV88_10355 [Candidatus Aminicenantes bacterium]|nr:MAG: hypothetical protein JSV88_10355 [Candidatus Aminicenantes bacterium]
MSVISAYISQVKKTIDKLPGVLSDELIIDNRGDVVLYLKGKIVFTNQSELHLKEYFISVPEFKKIAYSYHYQGAEKELIFRYDNAEHHQESENFPHHKHVGDKTFSAEEISLDKILEIIIDQMS